MDADTFVFSAAPSTGADTIGDFSHAEDVIQIENAVFTGLSAGRLNAGAFAVLAAGPQSDDRIIYDEATGRLFFDADGGTRDDLVLFSRLVNKSLDLDASDFAVI